MNDHRRRYRCAGCRSRRGRGLCWGSRRASLRSGNQASGDPGIVIRVGEECHKPIPSAHFRRIAHAGVVAVRLIDGFDDVEMVPAETLVADLWTGFSVVPRAPRSIYTHLARRNVSRAYPRNN